MKNREIKFRIWNGSKMEHNIMAGFLGAFYVQGIDEKDSASMSSFNTKYFDTIPVMQYTGLKDKEGKDIYEGDILEHLTDKNTTRKKVVYDAQHGAFIMRCEKYFAELRATYGDENMYADTYLIIGNIFENAELLTTQAGRV